MATPFTRSYEIHSSRLEEVLSRLQGLSSIAVKLGLPHFNITQGEAKFRERKSEPGLTDQFFEVELTGIKPVLGGWRFLAKVEHLPEGNILKGFDADEAQERFHNCPPNCDHCNTNRQRKNTFIVADDQLGKQLQVGSSCISDFIGGHMDPHLMLELMDGLGELKSGSLDPYLDEGEEPWVNDPQGRPALSTVRALEVACAIIRKDGKYISSAKADELVISSTADEVLNVFYGRNGLSYLANLVTESDREQARDVLHWMQDRSTFEPSNTYRRNLSVLAAAPTINPKAHAGLLVSAPAAYRRYQADQRQQEQAVEDSQHLGAPGDKLTGRRVRFEAAPGFLARWGYSANVLMTDVETGAALKWTTSSALPMKAGAEYVINGSIKHHGEYNGIKQTELTRVSCPDLKLLDDLSSYHLVTHLCEDSKARKAALKKLTDANVMNEYGETLLLRSGLYADDSTPEQWRPLIQDLLAKGADPVYVTNAGQGQHALDVAITYGGGSLQLTECYLSHLQSIGVDLSSLQLAITGHCEDPERYARVFAHQENAQHMLGLLEQYGVPVHSAIYTHVDIGTNLDDELEPNTAHTRTMRMG